jgi:hypothetical protein
VQRATAPTLLHTSLYFTLPAEPGVIWASDAVIDRLRVFDVCTVRDAWIPTIPLTTCIYPSGEARDRSPSTSSQKLPQRTLPHLKATKPTNNNDSREAFETNPSIPFNGCGDPADTVGERQTDCIQPVSCIRTAAAPDLRKLRNGSQLHSERSPPVADCPRDTLCAEILAWSACRQIGQPLASPSTPDPSRRQCFSTYLPRDLDNHQPDE